MLKSIRKKYPLTAACLRRCRLCRTQTERAPRKNWKWTVQIVKRSDNAGGFERPPRRWVVERELSLGSADAASPRISRQQSPVPPPGSRLPTFACLEEKPHINVRFVVIPSRFLQRHAAAELRRYVAYISTAAERKPTNPQNPKYGFAQKVIWGMSRIR